MQTEHAAAATVYLVWGDYADVTAAMNQTRTLDSIHATRESATSRATALIDEIDIPPYIAEWKLHG